jgi:hypothetical protein
VAVAWSGRSAERGDGGTAWDASCDKRGDARVFDGRLDELGPRVGQGPVVVAVPGGFGDLAGEAFDELVAFLACELGLCASAVDGSALEESGGVVAGGLG